MEFLGGYGSIQALEGETIHTADPASFENTECTCGAVSQAPVVQLIRRSTAEPGVVGLAADAESIDISDFLPQDVPVKEEQGVESLVLGGGGNPSSGQFGEEDLHFEFGGDGYEFAGFEKEAVTAQPAEVGFLGANGEVFSGTNLSSQTNCVINSHPVIYERDIRTAVV